ncbi:MAG: carboxypeptidase-like regulatory domain-containing protein [Bacteroidota bacterium]|nr:carboxypeptidase-like regulatory domain-containing protein [Bacteroidota bacterium]
MRNYLANSSFLQLNFHADKKIFFALLLFVVGSFSFGIADAQQPYYTIKGKIVDKNTKAPLQGASVFAQNTTFGVASDSSGNFTLRLPDGGYSIIVTYSGYETESVRASNTSSENDNLVIEIGAKEKSLEEVSIAISSEVKDGWEKYGVFFTQNFLGQTKFARQAIIQNPDALHFYFSKKRNRLKVLATEPLTVQNFALGYTLKFAIDSFTYEYGTNANLFVGYPLFTEMAGTPDQKATWAENRAMAYKGSIVQFMRSLYHQTLTDDGYELQFIEKKNDKEASVPLTDLYAELNYEKDSSTSTIEFHPQQTNISVIYNKAKPEQEYLDYNQLAGKNLQVSRLIFAPDEVISIEQNGYYFDQTDITTNGYMGFKKIADMLPYDYEPQ